MYNLDEMSINNWQCKLSLTLTKKIGKANHDAYNLKQKNLYIICCKNLNILDTFMMHKLIIDCY